MIYSDLQWKEGFVRLCPSNVERKIYCEELRHNSDKPLDSAGVQEDSNMCLNLAFVFISLREWSRVHSFIWINFKLQTAFFYLVPCLVDIGQNMSLPSKIRAPRLSLRILRPFHLRFVNRKTAISFDVHITNLVVNVALTIVW